MILSFSLSISFITSGRSWAGSSSLWSSMHKTDACLVHMHGSSCSQCLKSRHHVWCWLSFYCERQSLIIQSLGSNRINKQTCKTFYHRTTNAASFGASFCCIHSDAHMMGSCPKAFRITVTLTELNTFIDPNVLLWFSGIHDILLYQIPSCLMCHLLICTFDANVTEWDI
jgi:hypothetical protein